MEISEDSTYELPKLFKDVQKPLRTKEEREIALLSTLTIFPAFFPKAHFKSVDKLEKLNLYTAIFLPAASGKRLIESIGGLARPTERQCMSQRQRSYNAKTFASDKTSRNHKSFLVTTNITASRLAQKLERNGGNPLLMIETEMDSLTNSIRGEHGRDISVMLRKSYENEPISLSRKKDDEDIFIEEPWLGLLAGGTMDSFNGFFKRNSDGLMSRFLFYAPETVARKSSVLSESDKPLEVYYRELGENMISLYDEYFSKNIEVVFTEQQYRQKDEYEVRWEKEFSARGHENFVSMIRRMGARAMRIGAILSIARFVDGDPETGEHIKLNCGNADFDFGFELADKYLSESYRVFVESGGINVLRNGNKRGDRWYKGLPSEFSTREAEAIGFSHDIPSRTVKDYLRKLLDSGGLVKVKHGRYRKPVESYALKNSGR